MPRRPPPSVVFVVRWGYPRAGRLTLEAAHERPCPRQERTGEIKLEKVADDEWVEAGFEGVLEARVDLDGEPGEADRVDDDVAGEHRRHRGVEVPVPALLGEEAGQDGREDEADD